MTDPNETAHERHRRSIRLRGYDYSENGAYFVTICTRNREHLFGEIENGKMRLNDIGNIVQQCWSEIPSHYPFVVLDAFVIMPNHIHGILIFENDPVSDCVRANHHSPCSRIAPDSVSDPVCESNSIPDPVRANHHSPDPAFEFMSVPAIGYTANGNGYTANGNGFRANEDGNGANENGNGANENGNGCRANDNSPLQEERKQPAGTSGTVGAVIRGFKIGVTKWCRAHARTNVPWHRNYYERVIRDNGEWNAFREYIGKNPEMWEGDTLNSSKIHSPLEQVSHRDTQEEIQEKPERPLDKNAKG